MGQTERDDELRELAGPCYRISVWPLEVELRQRVAVAPPSGPGRMPSVPVIRAQSQLAGIEQGRMSAIVELAGRTERLDAARIEELKRAGILDALVGLAAQRWCPADVAARARSILVAAAMNGADAQRRYLGERGGIRALCGVPDGSTVSALLRILSAGESGRAECGRNLLADQFQACGGLDWLERLKQREGMGGTQRGEIEEIISRFFLSPGGGSAGAGPPDTTDRGLGWRMLYPFLTHGRFPQWDREEAAKPLVEETCPLAVKLFISHRWRTPEDPDPKHEHLPTVVEYLTRVYMVANGFLSEDASPNGELVIGEGLRSAFHESRLEMCRCGSEGWLDVRSLLDTDDLFYERVADILRRRNFYRLLKHVRVWYDYSSLPQARRTREEEAAFQNCLTHLARIVGGSEVLTLWGTESLNRAWCIFEVLAAKTVHFCSPRSEHAFGFMQRPVVRWAPGTDDSARAEELAAYRGRPSQSILITVNDYRQAMTGLSPQEIREYLPSRGIECTKPEDLDLLAGLIHRHLLEVSADSNQETKP